MQCFVRIGPIEEPQFIFHGQDAGRDIVDSGFRDASLPDQIDQRVDPESRGIVAAALDVQTVQHRKADRVFVVHGDVMVVDQSFDAAPVGTGDPLQFHSVFQNRFEVVRMAHHRFPVDGVVADHHIFGSALRDGCLEDRKVISFDLALTGTRIGAVRSGFGHPVRAKMLGFGHDRIRSPYISFLLPLDDGGGHSGGQIGIFSERFLHSAPSGFSGHIQIRGQDLVDAQGPGFTADRPADLFDEVRIERRTQIQRDRENGSPDA